MRERALVSALLLSLGFGCGDGIGQPIVVDESVEKGAAGAGGTAVGGAAGTSAGAGSSGASANAGQAQAGGASGNAGGGLGGADRPFDAENGPENDQPWQEGFGGRGGADWGEENPMDAVPPGSHCERVASWDESAARAEQELFRFLNFARESGFSCGSEAHSALPALAMRPELRCAARLHSLDMEERDFVDHVNPDGVGPEDRMRRAGASFAVASETIAQDLEMSESEGPYQAISELFAAGGSDCKNLLDVRFDSVGIGMFEGLWTLDFAGP